jgi:DNA invertase Pin-like site-specific DNA recombinase
MSAQDTAIRRIQSAVKARQDADSAKRKATDDLRRYCLEAKKAGVPVTSIASSAGVSRQAVYDLLGEQPSP